MANQQQNLLEINLLPAEFKTTKLDLSWLSDARVIWSTISVILVFTILTLFYYRILDKTNELENRIKEVKEEVAKEKPFLEDIEKLEKSIAEVEKKSEALHKIQTNHKRWVALFQDLSTAMMPSTWITNITQNGEQIKVDGTTWAFSDVALYMLELEKKASITEIDSTSIKVKLININTVKINGEDAYSFSLIAGFKERAE